MYKAASLAPVDAPPRHASSLLQTQYARHTRRMCPTRQTSCFACDHPPRRLPLHSPDADTRPLPRSPWSLLRASLRPEGRGLPRAPILEPFCLGIAYSVNSNGAGGSGSSSSGSPPPGTGRAAARRRSSGWSGVVSFNTMMPARRPDEMGT